VRASIIWTLFFGVATQLALRSVPSLVFNGERGMAAELRYTNSHRGAILSSFGWAYTAGQIPGGYLSQVIGPKRTLLLSVALGAVAGLLVPASVLLAAEEGRNNTSSAPEDDDLSRWGDFALLGPVFLNGVIGLSQGPVFPVVKGVLAQWLRPEELARGNALVVSASWNTGQVVQNALSPWLLNWGGWRLAWYVYSPLGLVFCAIWACVGADSPRQHRRVGPELLDYLAQGSQQPPPPPPPPPPHQQRAEKKPPGAGAGAGRATAFNLRTLGRVCRQRPVVITSLCLMLDGAGQAYWNWMPQYYSTQLDFELSGAVRSTDNRPTQLTIAPLPALASACYTPPLINLLSTPPPHATPACVAVEKWRLLPRGWWLPCRCSWGSSSASMVECWQTACW
jgi:MFS family permease